MESPDEFRISESRGKIAWLVAALVAVIALFWLTKDMPSGRRTYVAGLGVFIVVVCTPFWILALFRPATLAIGPRGVSFRSGLQSMMLDWANIESIELRRYWGSAFTQNAIVFIHLVRPQPFRRLLGWDNVTELGLNEMWPIPQSELVEKLTVGKDRFGATPLSPPVDPVAM